MTQPLKYAVNDPLSVVIDFLEKANQDKLATDVLDVFANFTATNEIEKINLLAKLYLDIRNIPKAEEFALKVLSLSTRPEEMYSARGNLAKMYNLVNEPAKSIFYSKLNAAVDPNNSDTSLETVFSLYLLGRKKEAEVILRGLKAREHEISDRNRDVVNFNLGTYDMEAGHFLKGLSGFMLNVQKLDLWFSAKKLPFTFWNGGIFPGRTLIMFMEGGGIGDEFITIRFMDNLKALGFDPVYYTTRKDLYNIFNRCGFKTITTLEGVPADSLWTYAAQTPIWLEMGPEQMMRSDSYLYPAPEFVDKWAFMNESKKLKIGIRWQGNAKNERDLHRKVPMDDIMAMLLNLFKGQEVEYYSLQIGDGEEETANYPQLMDISDKVTSYNDTLALLKNLDYVITSCTSVLHASAIVGTKTLGLIPISAYFTWLHPVPDNKSIYYGDNLRVFKQIAFKSWVEPIAELRDFITNDIGK